MAYLHLQEVLGSLDLRPIDEVLGNGSLHTSTSPDRCGARAGPNASALVQNQLGSDAWGAEERQRLREKNSRVPSGVTGRIDAERLNDGNHDETNAAELKNELLAKYELLAKMLGPRTLRCRDRPTTEEARTGRVQE
ncbi:MAG: hypothetical protein KF867_01065 [Cryobacterium sp.]|nr:hypothetical protein [Cryobacterium sp.]